MDLSAYANIDILDKVAEANHISVPRLRGYRLMKFEDKVDLTECLEGIETSCCEELVECSWIQDGWYTYSPTTDRNKKKYMTWHKEINTRSDGSTYPSIVFDEIKWEKIHGKHRKALKLAIKQKKKSILAQFELFNRFAGRDDVLYIHTRIGGNNWTYYEGNKTVATQPWFLGRADDCFDCTYCDIYAKIDPETAKDIENPYSKVTEQISEV